MRSTPRRQKPKPAESAIEHIFGSGERKTKNAMPINRRHGGTLIQTAIEGIRLDTTKRTTTKPMSAGDSLKLRGAHEKRLKPLNYLGLK